MSGQQIGTVVGGVIGAFFGAPQIGMAIGGLIGGAISPDVIKAPSIGDAQKQTSQAGVPRPVVYGHPAPFAGNIIDGEQKARKIIVKTRQGKGGPIVKSERFLLTTAIRICEAPIAGVVRMWRNGEVVYDRRTEADVPFYSNATAAERLNYLDQMRAKTANFRSKVVIYTGTESQLPDPSLEAIHGVGNTPYYRGTAYMVVTDDDVTDTRGAAAQYQFEVLAVGTEQPVIVELKEGRRPDFTNSHFPLPEAETNYEYTGYWVTGDAGGRVSPAYPTIAQVKTYYENMNAANGATPVANALGAPVFYLGYIATTGGTAGAYTSSTLRFDVVAVQPNVTDYTSLVLLYQWVNPSVVVNAAPNAFCPLLASGSPWQLAGNGQAVRRVAVLTSSNYLGVQSCADGGGGLLESIYPLCIKVSRKRLGPKSLPTGGVLLPDSPGYYLNSAGATVKLPGYTEVFGTYKVLTIAATTGADPITFSRYEYGPLLPSTDPNYNSSTFWTAAYNAAVAAGALPSGYVYGGEYPVEVTSVWRNDDQALPAIIPGAVTLQGVIENIADRCDVPAIHIDASSLSDIIPGFLVAEQYSGADTVRPTQQAFFYDLPEKDGKIVAIKRGGVTTLTITDDDLLESGADDERVRAQAVDYPLKVSVITQDPAAEYAAIPQTSGRTSLDFVGSSEVVIQLPIPFRSTDSAKIAHKIHKVMHSQAEGRIELALPENFSQRIPSDTFYYQSKRWLIEESRYSEGQNNWKAVYDRASSYGSTSTGVAPTPPTLPSSGLRGPTLFAALNLPQLRTADSTPGMYVAAQGVMAGWQGASLELSVDGGMTYQPVLEMTDPATLGVLTTAAGVSGEPLAVTTYGDNLFSVTAAQIAVRENAFALVTAGVSEIGQFQTATEPTENNFNLTVVTRGLLGTTAATHNVGDRFVLLDTSVYFLPLDISLAGKTLIFRPVTMGTVPENNASISFLYQPIPPPVMAAPFDYITASGEPYVTVSDELYTGV